MRGTSGDVPPLLDEVILLRPRVERLGGEASGYRRIEGKEGLMVAGVGGIGIVILVAVVLAALALVYLISRPRTH